MNSSLLQKAGLNMQRLLKKDKIAHNKLTIFSSLTVTMMNKNKGKRSNLLISILNQMELLASVAANTSRGSCNLPIERLILKIFDSF